MRAFLKSSEGCFQLKPHTTTIGSHRGADIVLQSAGVADRHAALEFSASDNSFILQDFNSPHGTFVNSCQVQNAAVGVRPGDILRFGTAGVPFELVLEGAAQVSCPPLKRRTGWAGQLQVVAEPKPSALESPPRLPSLQWQHPPGSPGSGTPGAPVHQPHPPLPRRPLSAWDRSVASTASLDTFSRSSVVRPVSTSFSGDCASSVGGAPSLGTHNTDLLQQEKGEKLLQLEKEMGHLSGLETKRKDVVIRDLQEEVAAMAKKLAQAAARNEVELTQKLLAFNQELGGKTEEIKALREQISDLQKGSSQVFSHSLYERDLEIGRLRRESEKLKKDQALSAGLVSSLQREVLQKEQKIQQLQQEIEKLKKENREKDNQLAVVSAKCSRIKEETKRERGEQEIISCRNRIGELERDLEGLQMEIQKHCAKQESIQNQLAEKAKAEEELEAACAQQAVQLREMGRRERLLRAELRRAGEQLESFKIQVMQVCSPSAAGSTGKSITEQQAIEKVRQICDENQQSHEREKCLQEDLSSRLTKEKEVSANIEVLKNSLLELQACLRSSCSSTSLRGKMEQLEVVSLDPSISAIRTAVVDMARVPLSWLEDMEQLVASAGMDLCTSGQGLLAAFRSLLEKTQEVAQRNQLLQEQLERLQQSQAEMLQEHTKELEAKHKQDLEIKIQQIILEKDKENKEILESTLAEEKDRCKKCVEEEQKKIQELESHLKSMNEATARKAEEQEVIEGKLKEALHELEETTAREVLLQQQVLVQDEQLRAVQEDKELQRQKLEEEIAGYREQSKQHSLTIVALEDRLLEATQEQKMLEEEKAALVEKMEVIQRGAHRSASGDWLEVCPAMESHICLRKLQEELAVAQSMLLEKEAFIGRLTRELSESRARVSDMRGELSEEQKVELEKNQSRLKHREREVNQLREKLSQMSNLVEEKDRSLKAAAEELRRAQARCQVLRDASQQTVEKLEDAPRTPVWVGEASQRVSPHGGLRGVGLPRALMVFPSTAVRPGDFLCSTPAGGWEHHIPTPGAACAARDPGFSCCSPGVAAAYCRLGEDKLGCFFQVPPLDLADLGAKCQGLRHEETIQRQKEGLAELRERVKMLEKRQNSGAVKKGLEPRVKDLPEEIVQHTGLEMEPAPMSGTKLKAGKGPGHVPNGGSLGITNRAASLDMAEVTDPGERMYLDVIGALGSLMEMKELSGMQPLQHLPLEEREEVGLQRQRALELLYKKIRNLQHRLERKEEMLKDYEGSMEQLRQNQASLRRCQEEMSNLEDEAHREAEEKALLREALERTQLQLEQEKRLRRAAKRHKPGATKPLCSGKPRAKEHTADAVKKGSSQQRHHRGVQQVMVCGRNESPL
ncbi:forkhead-associated domain-containing protein 1 [Corapipo altera]|uniref:forkhead-associated domain-containing protein 1 n=1 Tax=Corapipo altera TaxID=415028 RepID=UPI000FD66384|nr:forkhead-associated domain-containing protein 1 [Corapipo altera]